MRQKLDYEYYYLRGARAFLCGRHIAVYNPNPKCWQHKASTEGDKAMRRFLFNSESPGLGKIREFHEKILKSDKRLELIERRLQLFRSEFSDLGG